LIINSELGRLSYHSTKIFTSGFYNAMHLREISTPPNWISDWKSWRYKRKLTVSLFYKEIITFKV